jgi:hypothetical protein
MEHILTDQLEMNSVRSLRLKAMLKMEIQGLKGRGNSAYSILKNEYGLRGSKTKVLERLSMLMCPNHNWMLVPLEYEKFGLSYVCGYPDCTVLVWKSTLTNAKRIVPGDHETRQARNKLHRLFDPLWEEKVFKSRHRAYRWLADSLGLDVADCHIGYFSKELCDKAIQIVAIKREIDLALVEVI